jgi:hypothetical protein
MVSLTLLLRISQTRSSSGYHTRVIYLEGARLILGYKREFYGLVIGKRMDLGLKHEILLFARTEVRRISLTLVS